MGVALDDPNSDAERDAVGTAKVAVRLGKPRLTPMAWSVTEEPSGKPGGFFDFISSIRDE